jgi:hypothetical protein
METEPIRAKLHDYFYFRGSNYIWKQKTVVPALGRGIGFIKVDGTHQAEPVPTMSHQLDEKIPDPRLRIFGGEIRKQSWPECSIRWVDNLSTSGNLLHFYSAPLSLLV